MHVGVVAAPVGSPLLLQWKYAWKYAATGVARCLRVPEPADPSVNLTILSCEVPAPDESTGRRSQTATCERPRAGLLEPDNQIALRPKYPRRYSGNARSDKSPAGAPSNRR